MLHFRTPGRRLVQRGLLIGATASAVLLGSQNLAWASPFVQPAPDPAASLSLPTTQPAVTFVPQVIELPAELPAAAIERDVVWTAPPIEDYAFERVATPDEVRAAESAAQPAEAAPQAEPAPQPATGRLVDRGIASTYGEGDGFQGRRTACGQRFDTNVPQVAHKSLPCGTTVRVEDAASGESVVAKVTDRGPYVAGRVVDLSWAAFSKLRSRPGLMSVNVYVVDGQN